MSASRGSIFVEPDQDRLYRRLLAVTGGDLTSAEVRRLAAGDLSLTAGLPSTSKRSVGALLKPETGRGEGVLEKMVGQTLDYVPVAYLDLARMASTAVARIVTESRQGVGTATLVSPRLLLTNHHVTPTPESALEQLAQFEYELQVDGVPTVPCEFRLDPAAFWWTSPVEELDATLVAVGARVSGGKELAAFGMCSLTAAENKHALGDFVTIVQHPEGDHKQIALRENRLFGRGHRGVTLHYQGDTLPGSSGSPVFNDQFQVVALHHVGGAKNESHLEDGSEVPADSNEGIRISSIVVALRKVLDKLPDAHRPLLAEALDPPSAGPRLDAAAFTEGTAVPVTPGAIVRGETVVPVRISFGESGATTTAAIVPGAAPTTTPEVGRPVVGVVERNQPPHPDYSSRPGYNPDFLTVEVPLPKLSSELTDQVAVLKDTGRRRARVLDYFHFSLVQNKERKMPFFTAVNIDGKRAKSINRVTGEVEASERWFVDPRIEEDEQLSQAVFEAQRPRIFDRGHLVRRLDPAWGNPATAKRAADDTFHFTNCSLQVSAFNQRAALWAGIEDYVLDNAKAERKRVSVFSGPVFGPDDPEYRGVPVPKAFWKVLVRVEDSELRATAFLAGQEDVLPDLESFDELGRVAVFQTAVATLEKRTGLDFGKLRAADTQRMESVGELTSFADVEW